MMPQIVQEDGLGSKEKGRDADGFDAKGTGAAEA